jgi:hypothetical protein
MDYGQCAPRTGSHGNVRWSIPYETRRRRREVRLTIGFCDEPAIRADRVTRL